MKFALATRLTSLFKTVLNALNSKGTALPGNILLKFYPEFLSDCEKFINGKKFAVTGTNGKSTTSSILAAILNENSKQVIHNTEGANMPAGIATTLALGLNKFKNIDNIVIEADEGYLKQIFEKINFNYLILTNLFEDQMDRHGSPLDLRKKIQAAINLNPDLKIITNADDPIFNEIQGNKIYYGVNSLSYSNPLNKEAENVYYCPKCGKELKYKKVYYSKIGQYFCTCGLIRPVLDYACDIKIFDEHFELRVNDGKKIYNFKVGLKGLFNAYNAFAAVVGALECEFSEKEIQKGFDSFKPLYGRAYTTLVGGKNVKLNLIKNAVGANETIKSLGQVNGSKILIAINNEYPDGRDFSWIYNVNFDLLNSPDNLFFISGSKASETAKRLEELGVNPEKIKIEPDLKKAVKLALNSLNDSEELITLMVFTAIARFEKVFGSA